MRGDMIKVGCVILGFAIVLIWAAYRIVTLGGW